MRDRETLTVTRVPQLYVLLSKQQSQVGFEFWLRRPHSLGPSEKNFQVFLSSYVCW